MATRANQPSSLPAASAPPATRSSAPSLARGASGPSLGSTPLLLRPGRGPWTWCISPARLGCRNGQIVPLPVPAYHAAGLSANVRGDNGAGYVGQLTRQGYKAVPHDRLPCVAFDASREGAPDSTYLHRWEGRDIGGGTVERWSDAWSRPIQFGHQVIWEQDAAGRDAFLVQCLIDLCNDGQPLSAIQIRMATEPLIDRIRAEAGNEAPAARKVVRQLAQHLPRANYTPEVVDILNRMGITIDETPE